MDWDQPMLLADDNVRDIELALSAMEETPLKGRLVICRDGADVLDYLYRRELYADRPEGNPRVVVLDLKMPKVDGLTVVDIMKRDPALKRIPIVIFTSSKEERDVARCYAAGVNAYVVKPVAFSAYVQVVRAWSSFWGELNEPPAS